MSKVELRRMRVSDAKRLYEILTNPNFIYFNANSTSFACLFNFEL